MEIRDSESTQAAAATHPAITRHISVPCCGNRWNSSATQAAPQDWPSSRAVAIIPLAEPLRRCGDEAMMMLLLGDWNKANPTPHTASRQAIFPHSALEGMR